MPDISRDVQIELYLRTRKLEGEEFDLAAVIQRVADGCRNIQQGKPFPDSDAALAFLREYALVRDLHLVGRHAAQLQKYGVTAESLAKCKEIINIFEKPKPEQKISAEFFSGSRPERFGRADLETLVAALTLSAKSPTKKPGG